MSCLPCENSSPLATTSALLTPQESWEMDRAMAPILPMIMERAGMMAARLLRQHRRPCRVLVACGPGNNGGDGYVMARYLAQWGWPVSVAPLAPPRPGSLAAEVAKRWDGHVLPFSPEEAARADLVVDAVFGAGMNRPLPSEVEAFFGAAGEIVAIDVPSGLDGASGALMGQVAACRMTIALIRRRPGHLLLPGATLCGDVLCTDLSIPREVMAGVRVRAWENGPALWCLPQQRVEDHKYTRGVVSVCGGAEMPGAAFFASEAARHAGAGMVRLSVPAEAALMYRLASPAAIVDTQPLVRALEDARRQVWVCGPGLSMDEVGKDLPLLQKAGRSIVADAGAFSWAAGDAERLRGATVITPHMGEFVRVFGKVEDNRLDAARRAAALLDAVVVLKGADTLIAAPDGRVAVNIHATPALAVAGAGDVLSGVIGTFLAAGMDGWQAAGAGVWVHGEAARRAARQKEGWIVPEDMFGNLGAARHAATWLAG